MKTCDEIDAFMTAYVDREVGADEAAAVREHLAECAPCRTRASVESTAREVLQTRAMALTARAPTALRARCVAAAPPSGTANDRSRSAGRQRRVAGWIPLSMVATALLALSVPFVLGQNERLEAAFAAQLAIDHDRCFAHLEDVALDFDDQQAKMRLARDHGLEVGLPPESADFDVMDVRRCLYADGEMAHVLCQWRGAPVSLYVVPDRSDAEQILEIIAHDAVTWVQGQQCVRADSRTGDGGDRSGGSVCEAVH